MLKLDKSDGRMQPIQVCYPILQNGKETLNPQNGNYIFTPNFSPTMGTEEIIIAFENFVQDDLKKETN